MNKNIYSINLIISIFYLLMYKTNFFIVAKEINIITCVNSFYFGMIAIQLKKYFFENKIFLLFSFILFLFLSLYKINSSFVLIRQIQGFALYIVLVQSGTFIMSRNNSKIIFIISDLSYSIYLYHHRIIQNFLSIYNPIQLHLHFILLSATFLFIVIISKLHIIIIKSILKSKIFIK